VPISGLTDWTCNDHLGRPDRQINTMLFRFVTALTPGQKQLILLLIDMLLIPMSLFLAIGLLRPWVALDAGALFALLPLILCLACAGAVYAHLLRLPRIKLNAYEMQGLQLTAIYAVLIGMTAGLSAPVLVTQAPMRMVDGQVLTVFTMILLILGATVRVAMRAILIRIYRRHSGCKRVLIYGAGKTGLQLAAALKNDDSMIPIAFIDDNPAQHGRMVEGLPVYGPMKLERLMTERRIDRVLLAMPSIPRARQNQIAHRIEKAGGEVRAVPSFAALLSEGSLLDRIQPIDHDTLLGRKGLEAALVSTGGVYAGKVVMITGAGGSIGSELARQLLANAPRKLVLFELSELALYQVERELAELDAATRFEIVAVLGSVTSENAVRRTIRDHGVEVILHAAAYKHVPLVETNPLEGLRNNVLGTKVLADVARDEGVTDFLLVSTDKAVNPRNVMGASKRLAELVVLDLAARSDATRFTIVRFGNVLGSSGSVVPLFEEQIARGGPLTLTHEEVTRYFMTIGEAARLVLVSGSLNDDGGVFVLDMGQPVPIRMLARRMIEAAGYTVRDDDNPDGDIEIAVTGLRPGEKLHEELVRGSAELMPTGHPKILQTSETGLSELEVAAAIKALRQALEEGDPDRAFQAIARFVTDYRAAPRGGVTLSGRVVPPQTP